MIPSLVQGLKLGWSFAWRSLMAGELLYASGALGFLLQLGRELNNISQIIAVMIVIVAIGVAVDRLVFGRLERWVQEPRASHDSERAWDGAGFSQRLRSRLDRSSV